MFVLSKKWLEYLRTLPETGMGYHVVTIELKDGRKFKQSIIDSGQLVRIRGLQEIPFSESDIANLTVTHDKWDWKREAK